MRQFKWILPFALALGWLFGLGALVGRPLAPAAASTIQSLIDAAPAGGNVSLPAGTYHESLTVGKTLTLTGAAGGTILQAAAGQRVITVTLGNSLKLVNLTLTGGQSSGLGGAIYLVGGSLTLVNCLITQNSAAYGGGVFQDGPSGRVDAINSQIERNTSANHGGGLYVSGSAAFTNTQVLSNTAGVHGGGVHVQNGQMDVLGGEFRNNWALGGNGGALNLNGGLSLSGTQIISNTAMDGGGVQQWNVAPAVYITSTRFERNTANSLGGGAAISGTLRVLSSTFASNLVNSPPGQDAFAGGLFAGGASLIFGSTFTDNVVLCNNDGSCSHADGGGLYSNATMLSITNSSFSGNQAGRMGGGLNSTSSTLALVNVAFRGNRAGWGGGLNHIGGSPTLTNVLFSGNLAGWGGGMLSSVATATLQHVTFAGNRGFNFGGGLENYGGTIQLVNSVLWGNAGTNGPQLYTDAGGTTTATYSDIQFAGVYTGTGNLNADPQFVQPITATVAPTTTGDYHVWPGSPLIDHGTPVSVTMDLDGNPRPVGAGFDIGAYECRCRALTLFTVGNGVLMPPAGAYTYAYGAEVPLTASANFGSRFSGWSGDLTGAANPTIVTMNGNKTVTATFGINNPPVANAGPNQTVKSRSLATLDGSASSDPDGDLPLTYHWAQAGGPAVTPSSAAVSQPTFTAPGVITHTSQLTFTLAVTDSWGLPGTTPAQVVITVVPYRVFLPVMTR